ncbi:MAG TPA: thioesterase family protein [Gemmatimonadaceae bacterium]|nr:thioesterase family protein [Gemmatimonadaceae bacterium]
MKLYFRFVRALLRALLTNSGPGHSDESVVEYRVWPTDLDFNLHLNNARYLSFMDLGRLDLLAKLGLLKPMLRFKWTPVVGAVTLRFRRGLDPWMRFTLHSRVLGWDEKWFYLEQRFLRDGEVYAFGLVRALFRGPEGSIVPEAVLAAFGRPIHSPELPPACLQWRNALEAAGTREPADLRRSA